MNRFDFTSSNRALSPRGERTRTALVSAARRVFERDGFADSRLSDITREARCSVGTFYTYFNSKEEVLAAVFAEAEADMLHPGDDRVGMAPNDPAQVIESANRAYFDAYRRNAKLMLTIEQVATIYPEFRLVRLARARTFIERNAKQIRKLQSLGIADAALDPELAARALSAMVARVAYITFSMEDDVNIDELSATVTRLWVNGLQIPTDDAPQSQ